jgi:hypothetical protein
MGLNVERSLKTIFPTQLKKIITHPSSCVFGIAPLLVMLKEHLYPFSLHVQSHKNHSIWLRNEENIITIDNHHVTLVMDIASVLLRSKLQIE